MKPARPDSRAPSGVVSINNAQPYRLELGTDNATERKERRKLLEDCAGSGALLAPTHFGAPHLCRIDHKGDGFTPRFG